MRQKTSSFTALAIILIVLGLILMLETFNIVNGIIKLWPLLSLVIGIGFCLLFYQRKKKDLILLGLGTFITLISVFFFYLNFTSWWNLSYLWSMFVTILGLSFVPPFYFRRNFALIILAALLIGAGVSFILVFSISGATLGIP